jgi:hypothetical protein
LKGIKQILPEEISCWRWLSLMIEMEGPYRSIRFC